MTSEEKLFELAERLPSPAYLIDEAKIISNLEILHSVAERSGAKILLAQKAFSCYHLYPLIGEYLAGTTASSLHEARLGYEYMPGRETHVFSPAFREDEFDAILDCTDHIVFNSFTQLDKYRERVMAHERKISIGLRLNPECQTQLTTPLYDPCAPFSRLGVVKSSFQAKNLIGVEGFHMHTLCEQNSDDLVTTIAALEANFGEYLSNVRWLNLGGGHHITRADYDVDVLVSAILRLREKYDLEIYLEPGEAIALNAGYLFTEVLDFVENGMQIAILDSSAECHMPDVLAMPYLPKIIGARAVEELTLVNSESSHEYPFVYRLSSATCLAGDVVGDYGFAKPLQIGERLVLCDMAIYTMVKNNTFNGINLPAIVLLKSDGSTQILKEFGYEDFVSRL